MNKNRDSHLSEWCECGSRPVLQWSVTDSNPERPFVGWPNHNIVGLGTNLIMLVSLDIVPCVAACIGLGGLVLADGVLVGVVLANWVVATSVLVDGVALPPCNQRENAYSGGIIPRDECPTTFSMSEKCEWEAQLQPSHPNIGGRLS
ncbi:hypothetical protein Ahy_B10g102386 [Arachis hypogaea]|uniref:Uncharacterized protein n=1 Tax=Arachis hypogaea TaxID=3818 RepID=A0A444X1L7_ARAHY|nr:hypothetical protein Ahy_B10g102386 [Arachis hypogaea]